MSLTGNFSENARMVLAAARTHATRHKSEAVSPDHLLLGITDVADCVAAVALVNLGTSLQATAKAMEGRMQPGQQLPSSGDLPYSSSATRVLELAMTEARDLGHSYVGSEHLLLGVLREGKSAAASVLQDQQASTERVRPEVMRLLRSNRQSIVRGGS